MNNEDNQELYELENKNAVVSKKKRIIRKIPILFVIICLIGYISTRFIINQSMTKDHLDHISSIFNDSKPLVDFRNEEREAYRFYWYRAFHESETVLITVIIKDDKGLLNLRVCDLRHNNGSYELVTNNDIELTKGQVQKLRITARGSLLWFLIPKYVRAILDGSQWIIEVKRHGIYFRDSQDVPTRGNVRKMGLYLTELSQLKIDPNAIY